MKALTGLPTSAYVSISEEARIQVSDLLSLVQEFEAGTTPAYLAHYRPDISQGLDEERLRDIEQRLREFLELEERRITVLAAIGRQDKLTPELRERIETVTDRWELEDLYLPFKPRRRGSADEAAEQGLEPLARLLWEQQVEVNDIAAAASPYVNPEKGLPDTAAALRGAREIMARWIAEDAGMRRDLRSLLHEESQLVVRAGRSRGKDHRDHRKHKGLIGYRAKLRKVSWRQMLSIRRAAKESGISWEIRLPENQAVVCLLERLIRKPKAPACLQIAGAAREAFLSQLAPAFQSELAQAFSDRCDDQAIRSFRKTLRKLLMSPPAGPITVIGLETGRPGGWRAAVVGPQGEFLEGAAVYQESPPKDDEASKASTNTPQEKTKTSSKATTDTNPEKQPQGEDLPQESSGSVEEKTTSEEGNPDDRPVEVGKSDGAEANAAAEDAPATAKATDASQAPPSSSGQAIGERSSNEGAAPSPEQESGASQAPPPETSATQPSSGDSPGKLPETPKTSLGELIAKHEPAAIVMANGPGVRKVERFVRGAVREAGNTEVFWTAINDAGAWIYATSKLARRDFPNLEPALRSAICLARRLQDPLAEMVRIDPRVLGIGQYHHEVDQRNLRAGLQATVESCAHKVGVDPSSASMELLALLPGMTERLAKRVVEYREQKGSFTARKQLLEVSGLNSRIFKQAAGFVRIPGAENPLEQTSIHPDHYAAAEKVLSAAGISSAEALQNPAALETVDLEQLQGENHPVEILRSIVAAFQPSVRNPRGEFKAPEKPVDLLATEDLKLGKKLPGVVTNIANFGAFVDIGADQDGLVHVSQFSDKFVDDPKSAVKVGDRVEVYILALEEQGKRISLSLREPRQAPRGRRPGARQGARAEGRRRDNGVRRRKEPQREGARAKRSFGPDPRQKAREEKELEKLTLEEKLALLKTKYKTKV